MFKPGAIWNDVDGKPIDAHCGGVLYDDGVYYWYGNRFQCPAIPTGTLPGQKFTSIENLGVSIYSSRDLPSWKFEGLAFAPVQDSPNHLLQPMNFPNRPKVIRNPRSGKYIMMAELVSADHESAMDVVVAVADSPRGPFEFKGKLGWIGRPDPVVVWSDIWPSTRFDPPSRIRGFDIALFKDDDGRGYLVSALSKMWLYELTPDYLSVAKVERMVGAEGEAPAIFKSHGAYYLVSSRLTGFAPNENTYFTSLSMQGPWQPRGPFAHGPRHETTFDTQVTFVLPLAGCPDAFIFMADRFNAVSQYDIPVPGDCTHVWLPIELDPVDRTIRVTWRDTWDLSVFEGASNR